MKQEELNTTGSSTQFTSGLACGWIKRNGILPFVTVDFLSVICRLGRQIEVTPLRVLKRFIQVVLGALVDTVRGNVVIPCGVACWMWEKFIIVRI